MIPIFKISAVLTIVNKFPYVKVFIPERFKNNIKHIKSIKPVCKYASLSTKGKFFFSVLISFALKSN